MRDLALSPDLQTAPGWTGAMTDEEARRRQQEEDLRRRQEEELRKFREAEAEKRERAIREAQKGLLGDRDKRDRRDDADNP